MPAQAAPQTLEERVKDLRHQVQRLVKAPGAPLKSAPFHTASTLQSLPTGTEVLIVISTTYWFGVETHDGQHGWILRDELEQLPVRAQGNITSRITAPALLWGLSIFLAIASVRAQTDPSQRSFQQSKTTVEKALSGLRSSLAGHLPASRDSLNPGSIRLTATSADTTRQQYRSAQARGADRWCESVQK